MFSVGSSSRFSFTKRTHTQTRRVTDATDHTTQQSASAGKGKYSTGTEHIPVSHERVCELLNAASRLTGRRIRRCGGEVGQSTAVVGPSSASAGRMLRAATARQRCRRRSRGRSVNFRRIDVVRTDVLVPRSVHRLYRHKTVTVTKVFILRFLLKDRKRITQSFKYIQRSPG